MVTPSPLQFPNLRATNTRLGRWRIHFTLAIKRWAWLGFVNGAAITKRALDIVVAFAAIIIGSPVFLIIAVLVKADGGPILFRQKRVGLMGREFGMFKFRSMCVDAEARLAPLLVWNERAGGITFKLKDDPRVTRVGRWIRRASIDELPQLFNVLTGEMSIVGPRPPVPREVALYTQADRRRFLVKPGITCLWQVGERIGGTFEIGDRNQIDFDEQVRLDLRYIEQQSLFRDLWIMVKTVPAMALGK